MKGGEEMMKKVLVVLLILASMAYTGMAEDVPMPCVCDPPSNPSDRIKPIIFSCISEGSEIGQCISGSLR